MTVGYLEKLRHILAREIWGNLKVSAFLAYKSIVKGNRWSLIMVILVIAFSLINLVFTSSIIDGVMTAMDDQIVNTMYASAIISPPDDEHYLKKASNIEAEVSRLPQVENVAVHLNTAAFFEYKWKEKSSQSDKGISGTWEVLGVDPDREMRVTTIYETMEDGRYLEENDRDEIVLGIDIAGGEEAQTPSFSTLQGVQVGEKVLLTYPNGVQREYTVKGIFRAREMNRADRLAFITRKEMASIFGRETYSDRASEILVKAVAGADEDKLIAEIKNTGIEGQVRGWREYGAAMRSVVSTFEIVGSFIGGIGLIVASAVMFILIHIGVINRKRQIGILRAIGIPHNAIVASYFIQALFYVLMGTALGWAISGLVLQPYFNYNPIVMPIGYVRLTVESAVVIGSAAGLLMSAILAGLIPPWTVMRESIIKIIWGI